MLIDRDHVPALGVGNKLLTKLPPTADYKSGSVPTGFQRASLALKAGS